MKRRRVLAASAALTGPLLTGCVGRSLDEVQMTTTNSGGGSSGPSELTVDIGAEKFDPSKAELGVGGTVTWENTDDASHRVESITYTSEASEWDMSEEVPSGESVSATFDQAGMYQFYEPNVGRYRMCGIVLVGGVTTDWSNPCL